MDTFPRYICWCCLFFSVLFSLPKIEEMSLEEKIGQLLMVHFHGKDANPEAELLIQKGFVGSIIYYNWANDLTSFDQVKNLSEGLQKLAQTTEKKIPLIIACDQEGGVVNRLSQGFTVFPGNCAIAMTKDLALAKERAFLMGRELKAAGINLNLAPVVDVNCNPKNPVIGVRSFSNNPQDVTAFAESAIEGFHAAGLLCTCKHFPGHGDTEIDSHENLPIIKKAKNELEKVELYPFSKLLDKTDAIITAHILVTELDSHHCATLSEKILKDLLRKEMGYTKLIISDSLIMDGVVKNYPSIDEVVIQALLAGCDILLLGGKCLTWDKKGFELTVEDVFRIRNSLIKAVHDGRIPLQRVNEAVEKILQLKSKITIANDTKPIDLKQGKECAKKIAEKAIKISKKSFSIKNPKFVLIAPEILKEGISQSILSKRHSSMLFYKDLNPTSLETQNCIEQSKNKDCLIIFSYNSWRNPAQKDLIDSLIRLEKPVILICARDPVDATLFEKADWKILTFDPTKISQETVCNMLDKELYP